MPYDMPAGCKTSDIDLSSNGDTEPIDELDELCVLDCGHSGTLRNAEESGGEVICEPCFIERKEHPLQLPDFRNQAERAEYISALVNGLEELS